MGKNSATKSCNALRVGGLPISQGRPTEHGRVIAHVHSQVATLRGSIFWRITVAPVAFNLASVAERNQVKIEQELLSQAVRRLAEVSAQLDADGPVVTGSQGQARPNPLLVVEQKLREEVDRRRLRVKDARSRYH
jgi:hypothetical protein